MGWGGERPARLRAPEVSKRGWGSCTSVVGPCVPTRSSPIAALALPGARRGGIPRQLEAKVGSIAAFRNPSPAPASLASLYLSGPSPGACPSPALCGSAVWPLKGNVGRACGSDGHTVVGASPAARLRSLLLPFSWETQMVYFSVSPYPPGPNLSALSCCWGERAPPRPCGSRVCFP